MKISVRVSITVHDDNGNFKYSHKAAKSLQDVRVPVISLASLCESSVRGLANQLPEEGSAARFKEQQ